MAITPTQTSPTFQQSARGYVVDHIVLHHCATTDFDGVVSMMTSGSRQVSANYVVKDNRVAAVVPENMRSWSLSSALWDGRSITFEIANESVGEPWPVSATSHETVARMVADIATRYGIPINRDRILGHREVYTRFDASYATACPGGLNLDAIVARAQQIASGGATTENGPTVITLVPNNDDGKWYAVSTLNGNSIKVADEDVPIMQRFMEWAVWRGNDKTNRWNAGAFKTVQKYISALNPAGPSAGGAFPNDYAREATVQAVGAKIATPETYGAAARAAIVK